MSKDFETALLEADGAVKSGIAAIIGNLGKTVAVITLAVACLVTFTDVSLIGVNTEKYATSLAVMVISSYVMYFSLLDVGGERGRESAEYVKAKERYDATRVKLSGDMMPALRDFCVEYSRAELEYRRCEYLMYYGLCDSDIKSFKDGREKRIRRRSSRLRAVTLSPAMLLSTQKNVKRGELYNPERGKILKSFVKLLPSTLCTCLTVSVVLSVKDGMTAEDVLNGLLKLAALPIVGIRGYVDGLVFAEKNESAWLRTRTMILESFLKKITAIGDGT